MESASDSHDQGDNPLKIISVVAPGHDPDFPDTATMRITEEKKASVEQKIEQINGEIDQLVRDGIAKQEGHWVSVSHEVAQERGLYFEGHEPPQSSRTSVGGGSENSPYSKNWERIFKGGNN